MSKVRRRRAIAASIVIAVATTTAYAQLAITPTTAPTNGFIAASTPSKVVFSIRNTSATNLDITGFTAQMFAQALPMGCSGVTIGRLDNPGVQAVTLAPNQQQQFVATSTGVATPGQYDCTFDIGTNPAMAPAATVTTSFKVSATPSQGNVQPTVMSFGSQAAPSFEVQKLVVENLTGAATFAFATINNDFSNKFSFANGCTGHTCNFSLPQTGAQVDIKCAPATNDNNTASLDLYGSGGSGSGSNYLGTISLQCDASGNAIQVNPKPLDIMPSGFGAIGTGTAMVTSVAGGGEISGAFISSSDVTFKIQSCNAQSCSFGSGLMLPQTLTIECQGKTVQTSGTLTVYGGSGVGSDSTTITCTSVGSPGVLDVDPTTIDMGMVDVGASGTQMTVTLRNTGGSPLSGVYVTFPTVNASDWTVASTCTMASPCTLQMGETKPVTVDFHPTDRNDRSSSFSVTATGGGGGSGSGIGSGVSITDVNVTLLGTGAGGELSATPLTLDFGTIPKSQPFTRMFTVSNIGNKPFTANVSAPSAPYSVTPSASQIVSPGTPQMYTVTCQSATASASNDSTLAVTSDAYANPNATINLKCAIADTMITVMPQQFDFGEVRVGSPTQMITITVANPGSVAAHISSMSLREARIGLSLVPPTMDITLQPGQSTTAVMQLTTLGESDLDGEFLDIDVDNAMLSLPVTGKVVTPHSRVAPAALDLGTACVGSQVTGTVMLINDGTAMLKVEQPRMDMAFSAASPPGVSYPSTLPAGMSIMATVSPAMSASGELAGTLTWHDDVPSDYMVPVKLDYVSEGTAVSPAVLDFGAIDVMDNAPPQHITIENCDPIESTVTIKSITTKNSPVGAWRLDPRLGYSKKLMPHDKQGITVTFAPPARGRYEADVVVEANGKLSKIHLIGDATGQGFDDTSFYACGCSGGFAPEGGAPILIALGFIVRRRRGSSSAR
jgi:hypothetical protein